MCKQRQSMELDMIWKYFSSVFASFLTNDIQTFIDPMIILK